MLPMLRQGGAAALLTGVTAVMVGVAGCSGNRPNPQSAAQVAGTNVPAPPSVDRSKCSDKGKQVITADTNQDKKPDVWKFFAAGTDASGAQVQVISCKQVDLNHDSKVDIVYYYDDKGAQTTLEEFDLDFDAKFDLTVYYVQGRKVREELDTNYDQRSDLWKYFEEEKLVRIERDTNGDSKVDEWQYYEGGKLDRIGYDTTGSGRVDRWDRAPEEEPGCCGGGEAPPAGGAVPAGGTTPSPAGAVPAGGTTPPATSPPAAAAPAPAPAAPAAPAAGAKTSAKK